MAFPKSAKDRLVQYGDPRLYVAWAINWTGEKHHEVIRYENGRVVLVGCKRTMRAAWELADFDRAKTLSDPYAIESRSIETRVRL